MPGSSEGGPPDPPFEAADEPVDKPAGKVRERVRQVLSSLSEPAKVSTIAEMADCSAEGARNTLREYAEMGLVVKTNDNPEMYERNPAYFRFLRGHRLAQEHTTEELRKKLVEKYLEHRAFADRFDAASPEAVEVDERESSERFDAVFEWEALLSEADGLREAYRQQTGTMPAAIEDLPTGEWSPDEDEGDLAALRDVPSIDPLYFTALTGSDLSALLSVAEQHRELVEAIQENLSGMVDAHQRKPYTDPGE
jgi:hypothetical protein